MTAMRAVLPGVAVLVSVFAASSAVAGAPPARVTVDVTKSIGTIGRLYGVGYNGWGDVTNAGMVRAFKDLDVHYCRMDVNLRELCGDKIGDYRWDYALPCDLGTGFTDRVRRIIANGWTPLPAFSYHGAWNALPRWFHGEPNDANGRGWVHYNLDGSSAPHGFGDQVAAATRIARDVVAHLAAAGMKGLTWETLYEMNPDMPLVEIHHAVASGVRQADPTARIVGPATWPGWSVEERFVKPYLAKHGADLLDTVSVHWYGSNDHDFWKLHAGEKEGWVLSMAHGAYLDFLMDRTRLFGDWTRSLAALLRDPKLNPSGKRIGILYSEIDVNATSYHLKNPENPDWPKYRADTDCWHNANYWGGVWWASTLCRIAAAGSGADAMKYNTRNYYGLADMAPKDRAYRYPVWFAMKLLRDQGGLTAGRRMLAVSAAPGPSPMVEAYATGGQNDTRVILINKSTQAWHSDAVVKGLKPGAWGVSRYLFDRTRVAQFRGRKPGDPGDGTFEGYPDDDGRSARCLRPISKGAARADKSGLRLGAFALPPTSFVVVVVRRNPGR